MAVENEGVGTWRLCEGLKRVHNPVGDAQFFRPIIEVVSNYRKGFLPVLHRSTTTSLFSISVL
jgi:hypothetical protein